MDYFKIYKFNTSRYLRQRLSRKKVLGFFNNFIINSGDIFSVTYSANGFSFFFEGICIFLKNKSMKSFNTSFILRNVVEEVGIELYLSYFFNRIFRYKMQDYKRKHSFYSSSKLFILRKMKTKLSFITS